MEWVYLKLVGYDLIKCEVVYIFLQVIVNGSKLNSEVKSAGSTRNYWRNSFISFFKIETGECSNVTNCLVYFNLYTRAIDNMSEIRGSVGSTL